MALTSIEPLKLEASGRKYYRTISNKNSYVICYDDSQINGQSVFVNRATQLSNNNVRVPEIFKYDQDKFLTILEDVGDNSLINKKNFYQDDSLILDVLGLLNSMHQSKLNNLDTTFAMGLESHTKRFSKIFCKEFLELEMFNEYQDFLSKLMPEVMNQQWGNCHFDFERRNIHQLENHELVLLDFQDLCFGPIGIDLAGILIDHYIPCDLEVLKRHCKTFSQLSIFDMSPKETYQATCWGGLQRNLRIMGTLTNLYLRFDRSFRMQDLPQIVSNTITLSLELEQRHLSSFLKDIVLPKLKKKMSLL